RGPDGPPRRRLAGATQGGIAARYDGHAERATAQHAAPIEPLARVEQPAIAARGHVERARGGRSDAALPDARDTLVQITHRTAVSAHHRPRARATAARGSVRRARAFAARRDRKSTRLNSSHGSISYAVICLKKNTQL